MLRHFRQIRTQTTRGKENSEIRSSAVTTIGKIISDDSCFSCCCSFDWRCRALALSTSGSASFSISWLSSGLQWLRVRDHCESDGFKRNEKKSLVMLWVFSHPWFHKKHHGLLLVFKCFCMFFVGSHAHFLLVTNVFYTVGERVSFVFCPKGGKLLFMAVVVCRHPKVNTWCLFQD